MPVRVRCKKCGLERVTHNDPRTSPSVIECKAKCFESHYEWEFVADENASVSSNSGPNAKQDASGPVSREEYATPFIPGGSSSVEPPRKDDASQQQNVAAAQQSPPRVGGQASGGTEDKEQPSKGCCQS